MKPFDKSLSSNQSTCRGGWLAPWAAPQLPVVLLLLVRDSHFYMSIAVEGPPSE